MFKKEPFLKQLNETFCSLPGMELVVKKLDLEDYFSKFFSVCFWFSIVDREVLEKDLNYSFIHKQNFFTSGYPSFGKFTTNKEAVIEYVKRYEAVNRLAPAMYNSLSFIFDKPNGSKFKIEFAPLPSRFIASAYGSFLFSNLQPNKPTQTHSVFTRARDLFYFSIMSPNADPVSRTRKVHRFVGKTFPNGISWDNFKFVGPNTLEFLREFDLHPSTYLEWMYRFDPDFTIGMANYLYKESSKEFQESFYQNSRDTAKDRITHDELFFKYFNLNFSEFPPRSLTATVEFKSLIDGWHLSVPNVSILPTLLPQFNQKGLFWVSYDAWLTEKQPFNKFPNFDFINKLKPFFPCMQPFTFPWTPPEEDFLKPSFERLMAAQDQTNWYEVSKKFRIKFIEATPKLHRLGLKKTNDLAFRIFNKKLRGIKYFFTSDGFTLKKDFEHGYA